MTVPSENMNVDLFVLRAARAEVEAADPSKAVASLYELLQPEHCQRLQRKLAFVIDGYDDDPRDLWELPDVCNWMSEVDKQWPFWFYFLNLGKRSSLPMVTFCLCPWKKVDGGKLIDSVYLAPFVRQRMAAMLGLCERFADDRPTQLRMATEILEFYGLDAAEVFSE